MELPDEVGVMTLPNAILFPQALLPLYIFEPRYREMLKECLNRQRMFAVALSNNSSRPHTIAGVGIIRACVDRPDGTSNLILQGVSRVRLKGFVQKTPYFIGKIELLETEDGDSSEVEGLARKALDLVTQLQASTDGVPEGITKFLEELKDYDALADIITYSFIQDVGAKQKILETLNLRDRLKHVVAALREQGGPGIYLV